jgi:hypothetical protein
MAISMNDTRIGGEETQELLVSNMNSEDSLLSLINLQFRITAPINILQQTISAGPTLGKRVMILEFLEWPVAMTKY